VNAKRGPGTPTLDPDSRPNLEYPSTLRSIAVDDEGVVDARAAAVRVYFQPQPLAAPSDHKTIEIETIKLAEDIDPRKLRTERGMSRPPPPPDLNRPQPNVVGVTNSLPVRLKRKRRTSLMLLMIAGVLLLLVLARGLAQRAHDAQMSAAALPAPARAPTTRSGGHRVNPALTTTSAIARPASAPPLIRAEPPSASPSVEVTPLITAPAALGSAPLAAGALRPALGGASLAGSAAHAVDTAGERASSLALPDPHADRAGGPIRRSADESLVPLSTSVPPTSSAALATPRSGEPKRAIY
jgi:hypothetical protein